MKYKKKHKQKKNKKKQKKIKEYNTVKSAPKCNQVRGKIDTPNTHIHGLTFWLGTGTSIKSGVAKLVFMGPKTRCIVHVYEERTLHTSINNIKYMSYILNHNKHCIKTL